MQSFSLNINANFNNDPFCDELIKSLSDDEDDDNYNEQKADNDVQISHMNEFELNHNYDHEDKKRNDIIVDEDEDEDEDEELSVHHPTTNDEESDSDQHDSSDDEEEEEMMIDYDKNLVLDKDISIATMLNKYGYKNVTKLCYTDQGSVWRAKSPKKFGYQSVVIKIASKLHYDHDKNTPSEHENILNEIELLQKINGQLNECNCDEIKNSVIRVIDTFETMDNYLVILEDGGIDLFNFVNECHQQISNEKIVVNEWQNTMKIIATKLIKLLNFLHTKMSVCHLDISLENVLISNIKWIQYLDESTNCYKKKLSPDFELRLIDFGAAQCFHIDINGDANMNGNGNNIISFDTKSVIGKPIYCSPQIYKLQNKLTDQCFDAQKTDIWSFGVCLFIMAIGCPPWQMPDERNNKLYQTIVIEKNLDFVLKQWKRSNYINDGMKDILNKIFVNNEEERISTKDIIKHHWII